MTSGKLGWKWRKSVMLIFQMECFFFCLFVCLPGKSLFEILGFIGVQTLILILLKNRQLLQLQCKPQSWLNSLYTITFEVGLILTRCSLLVVFIFCLNLNWVNLENSASLWPDNLFYYSYLLYLASSTIQSPSLRTELMIQL